MRVAILACLLAACAAPQLPSPLTAADLNGTTSRALVRGLTDGKISPDEWQKEALDLANSASPETAALLVDEIGRGYRSVLRRSDFEKSPALQARLVAMQRFYLSRKSDVNGTTEVDDPLFASLRQALAQHELGPVATSLGQELLDTVDVERGVWQGRPIDAFLLDDLYAAHDEPLLARFAVRLPQAPLRDEAKRRVVRLHIDASPFPEVRAQAAAVEERLMKDGVNQVALAEHPAQRGWIAAGKRVFDGVVVTQDVWRQRASLLGWTGVPFDVGDSSATQLRGVLEVQVAGISQPVTLCGPKNDLDPTPCLAARDVSSGSPLASVDEDGAFQFRGSISTTDALALVPQREHFVVSLRVGTQPVVSLEWKLAYARPADFVVSSIAAGGDAPSLDVTVDHRDPAFDLFTIRVGDAAYVALVGEADVSDFHVVSRGGQGVSGSDGITGDTGSSGLDCSNGSSGGDGGPGSDGGPGGDGGNVTVHVLCDPHPGVDRCDDDVAALRGVVLSRAGFGGSGGSGGFGGSGGAGGFGRFPSTHTDADGNTVIDNDGCSPGFPGSSGSTGRPGTDGAWGSAGTVRFVP